jgi:putative exosortase-associated protein (TIGR04073 family)
MPNEGPDCVASGKLMALLSPAVQDYRPRQPRGVCKPVSFNLKLMFARSAMPKFVRACLTALVLAICSASADADGKLDYGQEVGVKLGSAMSNMGLSWIEVPKNVVLTFNEYNFVSGMSLGVVKGVLHMLGRTLTGVYEFATFPLPTAPVATPRFVYENLDTETRYFPVFIPKK